jgi:uncharacterized protein (DUF305 family)
MRTKIPLTRLVALAVIALAAVAAGCGSDDDQTSSSAAGNATDAALIADMTAHHEGAIEMARIAKRRAEHPEVRRLAGDIISAQKGEISVMKTIRRDMRGMDEHGNAHMGMNDSEMGMDMEPATLNRATPFDRTFIDMMVPHHQGAIAMAKELLKKGEQRALRKMANNIIAAQSKEITQMRGWRKAWYGSTSESDHGMDDSGHGSDDTGHMDG